MNEEIEIEFKCVVTKAQFDTLVAAFNPGPFLEQHNHYFDTPDFLLKKSGSALRIREKNKKAEMTLKQPAEIGLLESTVNISAEAVREALSGNIPVNEVVSKAVSLINAANLVHFGTLTTVRAEIPYKGGLLVFDHSSYLGQEDYEIEFEAASTTGEKTFHQLLTEYNIDYEPADNKIRRFYQALIQRGGN